MRRGIEITFPVAVEIPKGFYQKLDEVITDVCKHYMATHPGRVMWTFGCGDKVLYMPMTKEEEDAGRHMEFDEGIYQIEVAEREDYEAKPEPKGD